MSMEAACSTNRQMGFETACSSNGSNLQSNTEAYMKVLAIGAAGKMGRAVVSYFANDPAVETLGLLDLPGSDLRSLAKGDETGRFRFHPLDIDSLNALREVMKGYDVGVSTL